MSKYFKESEFKRCATPMLYQKQDEDTQIWGFLFTGASSSSAIVIGFQEGVFKCFMEDDA